MALYCSFCGKPVGAVAPAGSPVSCCRACALENLPEILAEALLIGGTGAPDPAGYAQDAANFLVSFATATRRALERLVGPSALGNGRAWDRRT
jgi:hypothetical protein